MRELMIIFIILIIIFLGAHYTQKFLNTTSDELVGRLEDIKKNLESKDIGEDELKSKTNEIYKKWQDINEKWSVIVLHTEIDLIETNLIQMKAKIETGNLDDSMENLDTAIFLLKHIKEKEKTSLKNIF